MLEEFSYSVTGPFFSDPTARVYLIIRRANRLEIPAEELKFRLQGESILTK